MECLITASQSLTDDLLVSEVLRLAREERRAAAQLVAVLAEFDARRLYLPAGCSSLFTYCTRVLHLSEDAAYTRIEAARAVRRYPTILERLATGELTLTAVRLLAPCLTPANHEAVLQRARHLSKREIEHLVAALRPQPDVPTTVRKMPTVSRSNTTTVMARTSFADDNGRGCNDGREHDGGPRLAALTVVSATTQETRATVEPVTTGERPRAVLAPIAPERYKVQFTVSRETYDKLRRAQALLRHVVPTGDLALIMDRALTLLVADLERRKAAVVKQPRKADSSAGLNADCRTNVAQEPDGALKSSRHIAAAVRREVWTRDEGRCVYVGTAGRCEERGLLEFHHVIPFAEGGEATVRNIELRCRQHNRFEAERWFGEDALPTMLRKTAPNWTRERRECARLLTIVNTTPDASNDSK